MGLIAWPIATVEKNIENDLFISSQFMIYNSSIIMKITATNKIENSLQRWCWDGEEILWMMGWLCQN